MNLLFLCPMIFLAGFIDSIAGGGGLISLNSYSIGGLEGTNILGTNKFSSCIGSTFACINYIRTKNYHLVSLIPSVVGAIIGASFGSHLALKIGKETFTLLMLIITPIVAVITIINKDFSNQKPKTFSNYFYIIIGFLIGAVIGFYDGFYGPGTGMFAQLCFITICKLEPKKAAGNTRIMNFTSNIISLITFIGAGSVIYSIGIPCAACSVLGNVLGSKLAIKKDVKVIRPVMFVVVCLLFAKVLFDFILSNKT